MRIAPQLFAAARGLDCSGPHDCFYCGAPCDDRFTTVRYVAESFTERNSVVAPASPFVCAGCVEALRSDLGSVPLIDGTTQRPKEGGKRKPKPGAEGSMQVRWFSWIVTRDKALAATPAHRELIRAVCLSPPEPPFAICIADGNKHQLFRTPINHGRDRIAINCEGTRVDYHPDELSERIDLTTRLVAVLGKGASSLSRLADPACDMSTAMQLGAHYQDAGALHDALRAVRNQPLTELAIWLTPGKDDCNDRLAAASAD